jgi:hypothetical protein
VGVRAFFRVAILTAIAAGLTAAPAIAHEIGTTQVIATFTSDAHFAFDVVVDPDALLTKLTVLKGDPLPGALSRTERDKRIAALGATFLDAVHVSFDGVSARMRFEYRPASAIGDLAQAPSTVRLSGDFPSAARTFTFAQSLAMGSYALNVRIGDSPAQTFWVDGPAPSDAISLIAPPPASRTAVAWQHLRLGFTHIVPKGLDHILFVLGLFLLNVRWRALMLQISAFTLAHSITLGLTMYGIVSLPAKLVEPLIAVSIVYVAVENLLTSELKPWRVALVFSFGLLHGMGFAGVLRDIGLPRPQFLTALVAFNAGVEAGQLTVIAIAFALVAYWRSDRHLYRRAVVWPASIAISAVGSFWTLQRVFG